MLSSFNFPEHANYSVSNQLIRDAIYKIYKGECYYSGKPIDKEEMVLDHVWPRSEGGPDNYYNYVPTTQKHNQAKGSNFDAEIFCRIFSNIHLNYCPRIDKEIKKMSNKKIKKNVSKVKDNTTIISEEIINFITQNANAFNGYYFDEHKNINFVFFPVSEENSEWLINEKTMGEMIQKVTYRPEEKQLIIKLRAYGNLNENCLEWLCSFDEYHQMCKILNTCPSRTYQNEGVELDMIRKDELCNFFDYQKSCGTGIGVSIKNKIKQISIKTLFENLELVQNRGFGYYLFHYNNGITYVISYEKISNEALCWSFDKVKNYEKTYNVKKLIGGMPYIVSDYMMQYLFYIMNCYNVYFANEAELSDMEKIIDKEGIIPDSLYGEWNMSYQDAIKETHNMWIHMDNYQYPHDKTKVILHK